MIQIAIVKGTLVTKDREEKITILVDNFSCVSSTPGTEYLHTSEVLHRLSGGETLRLRIFAQEVYYNQQKDIFVGVWGQLVWLGKGADPGRITWDLYVTDISGEYIRPSPLPLIEGSSSWARISNKPDIRPVDEDHGTLFDLRNCGADWKFRTPSDPPFPKNPELVSYRDVLSSLDIRSVAFSRESLEGHYALDAIEWLYQEAHRPIHVDYEPQFGSPFIEWAPPSLPIATYLAWGSIRTLDVGLLEECLWRAKWLLRYPIQTQFHLYGFFLHTAHLLVAALSKHPDKTDRVQEVIGDLKSAAREVAGEALSYEALESKKLLVFPWTKAIGCLGLTLWCEDHPEHHRLLDLIKELAKSVLYDGFFVPEDSLPLREPTLGEEELGAIPWSGPIQGLYAVHLDLEGNITNCVAGNDVTTRLCSFVCSQPVYDRVDPSEENEIEMIRKLLGLSHLNSEIWGVFFL
ncbi:MAG: hypothetical protein D6698_16570 [Gammaproteobacteria bacterium]|nr:MAG: hypothetical protein D6698_16570 [Gammaproteobacteria bacterium]